MRLGDLDALKETINSSIAEATEAGMVVNADYLWELLNYAIDNASTVVVDCKNCDGYEAGYSAGVRDTERPQCNQIAWEQGYEAGLAQGKQERPQGECKTCIHRDPEDKKCDCGALERAGCPFPVSDDYFCKFYEKGGAE